MFKVTFPPPSSNLWECPASVQDSENLISDLPCDILFGLFSLPLPMLSIYAAFLPLSSLSTASQWEWECNYAVRRCLQTQKRLNLFQQLAVIPHFNLQLLHPVGKQEKQIVRTREEREREGAYGRYITEYSWRQLLQGLRTRKKAIAVGFIAHFLPVNGGFLACSIMEGVENKKIYICSWVCCLQLRTICSVTVQ